MTARERVEQLIKDADNDAFTGNEWTLHKFLIELSITLADSIDERIQNKEN